MAEAFLQLVLDNLSSLIQGEIGLIMGVDDEMKKLSSTLTTIQSVLEDAEMKQLESKPLQNWLIKLNDLSYDIDDILDDCATEVSKLQHRNSRFCFDSLKRTLYRHKIGRRMKQVTKQLDDVAAEREKFHLREMAIERSREVVSIRETSSILNESHHIYGREEDKKKIVDILLNHVKDNQEISILPIIGVGGLGKTTLAQLVFNDPQVVEHFSKRIWVCVSDNFDAKTLVKAMIESATGKASDLVHLEALQHRLLELLNQQRYLLVLDDVWNEQDSKWEALRNVLSCGSTGSSIVVTTRMKKVADIMRTVPIHYLNGLSEEHCWRLLRERAFEQEKEDYPNLEVIGKQIVKKCAGVPLAAKALGGLLRFKRRENDWIYVKESELWDLSQDETSILPALKLSYHHLPLELRPCFSYCAVFPKDSEIDKEELIFRWMAHGYISSKRKLEMEEVGNEICDELVLRSILQVIPYINKTTFNMHDLVHDLAQSIMENKVPGTQVERNFCSASNSKIRQVSLAKKYVVSPDQPEKDMHSIVMSCSRLRTLDAIEIKDLPSGIGNLKHLRYLNLAHSLFCTLPNSLCSLWNLKILNLDFCKKLVALPKNMRYLKNLRHLRLESCDSLNEMPTKIRELTCLRTLNLYVVGDNVGNRLEELKFLNLSGKLVIRHLERVQNVEDAKKANLAEKKDLRHLELEWLPRNNTSKFIKEDLDEKVLEALQPYPNLEFLKVSGFRGSCFPVWMTPNYPTLEKVVKIRILECNNCARLPQWGELPNLKELLLESLKAVEYIIEDDILQAGNISASQVLFPSLEHLVLLSLPNLKELYKGQANVVAAAFPKLKVLQVENCSSLILSPPLSSVEILSCSSSILASFSMLDSLTSLAVTIDKTMMLSFPVEMLEKLTNLNELEIRGADDALFMPEEGMQALKSLITLRIRDSRTLPEGWLQHLTALETLEIFRCPELVELPKMVCLHNLKNVLLTFLPKMVCLPEALQHLSSLEYLFLNALTQLDSLPEWLNNLTSLQNLLICNCPKLASLPDSIQGMANIRTLDIYGCPELKRRCEREKGEDWHKIAHIPHLQIGS